MAQRSGHYFPDFKENPDRPPKNPANWAIVGIFLIMAFAAVAAGRDFLMPVTMAILLFFVFTPLRRFAERRGVPDGLTALGVTAGILISLAVLAYAASGPLSQAVSQMPRISETLETKFENVRDSFRGIEEAARQIDEAQRTPATDPNATTVRVETETETTIGTMAKVTPLLLSQIILTLVLLFFMMASGDLLYLKVVQSFDRMRDKRSAYLALREIEDSLGNYLSAITIINACLGVAIGLAMWAWGMPAPLLFGVAAFVFNFIPYLGAIAGVSLAAVVALVEMPGLFVPMLVAGTYLFLTALEGQIITPYFVSKRLQMNTVVVFLAVALWAWLWSVIGMIIAVPVLVVIRVLAEHIPGWEKFGNFLAGEDPPQLEDNDEAEARDIVETGSDAEDEPAARDATAPLVGDAEAARN
ncbi:AI-2E family transporter [Paracoccus sp. (in: a-proteobacteria)]|uniref:AI-2E family transporter n=1 Tax=Paracoccus sp. TaxID=267 RepID=UPI0026DEC6F0|nr:AI-2E family transporter [Paracoccus sp. (in: a-proteobacteria)]MDO5647062.1 AI-2E family transporter [Paracoccus sp. (in: a-proteobacteria)]